MSLPVRTRTYLGHVIDSGRWDRVIPRDDDVVVATAYKAGTTWMQTIALNLVFQGVPLPAPVMTMSPWIDMRFPPLDEILAMIEAQRHRRVLKTHLALDGLRFFPQARYIYVGRDLRDVFMSIWNHHSRYSDAALERFREAERTLQLPWPACPATAHAFWRIWMSYGLFPWEGQGYPYWSMLHHLETWWAFRDRPNILFVHYNDLLRDLPGQIRRIAAYLQIEVDEALLPRLVDAATFDTMRANADRIMGDSEDNWQGGGATFLYKGRNQRWHGVLNDDDLALYDRAMATLPDDAAAWLENGDG